TMKSYKQCKWVKNAHVLLSGLVLAGSLVAFGGPVQAFPTFASVCTAVPADATRLLGLGTHQVQATSNGGSYANKPACPSWVVDVYVPSSSSGTGSDLKTFSFTDTGSGILYYYASNSTACTSVHTWEYLYRKRAGETQFQLIAWEKRDGMWSPGAQFVP